MLTEQTLVKPEAAPTFSMDPTIEPGLRDFAHKVVGLTMWPENPDSALCGRAVNLISLDKLFIFKEAVSKAVKDAVCEDRN